MESHLSKTETFPLAATVGFKLRRNIVHHGAASGPAGSLGSRKTLLEKFPF